MLASEPMPSTPSLSVIMPVHNAEQYLERCLDSIRNQTWQNWELICIDDGSTDSSPDLLLRAAKQDERIRVFRQQNGGVSSARNTGLLHIRGTYVAFVDSDDVLLPPMFEALLSTAKEEETIDLTACGILKVYPDRRVDEGPYQYPSDLYGLLPSVAHAAKFLHPNPFCKLYKSDILKKHHLLFDETLAYGEDAQFNYLYYQHCRKIAVLPTSLYLYYQYQQSAVGRFFSGHFPPEAYLHSISWQEDILKKCPRDFGKKQRQQFAAAMLRRHIEGITSESIVIRRGHPALLQAFGKRALQSINAFRKECGLRLFLRHFPYRHIGQLILSTVALATQKTKH